MTIKLAMRNDAKVAGATIAAAFADDPVNLWLFGSGAMEPTFSALAHNLYLKRGFGHLASGDQGAALWLIDAREKEAGGLIATIRVATALGLSAGVGAMRRGLALDSVFTAAHPPENHAYLFAIGVVPSAQGKGIGGGLLRAGLERVDAAHLPCYLESTKESNVPLYRHFGFEELASMKLPPGCPPIWPMWRAATK